MMLLCLLVPISYIYYVWNFCYFGLGYYCETRACILSLLPSAAKKLCYYLAGEPTWLHKLKNLVVPKQSLHLHPCPRDFVMCWKSWWNLPFPTVSLMLQFCTLGFCGSMQWHSFHSRGPISTSHLASQPSCSSRRVLNVAPSKQPSSHAWLQHLCVGFTLLRWLTCSPLQCAAAAGTLQLLLAFPTNNHEMEWWCHDAWQQAPKLLWCMHVFFFGWTDGNNSAN